MREGLGDRGLGGERPPPGEELECDHAQRIAVGGCGRRLPACLLGREITRSPEDRARKGERVEPSCRRDPEVADVDAVCSVEEKVPRLHIAVDDLACVGGVERARGRLEPAERPLRVNRAGAETVVDGSALEELHDDVRAPLVLADVEHGDDVLVARELRGGQRLALEACAHVVVARVPLGEHLHGDDATEHRVRRAIDLAHPAARDAGSRRVPRGEDTELDPGTDTGWYPPGTRAEPR